MWHITRPAAVVLTVIVLLSALLAPAVANPLKSLEHLFDKWELFQGVQISGTNSLTLQENRVEGSAGTFEGQRWDTGTLERRTSLSVEGPIWKELGFQTDLSFSGYGPSYSRWLVGYVGHDSALYYGDLNISLRDNPFAGFAKSLKGWQFDQKLPADGMLRVFTSSEKGYTRNETFSGNDTPGPYFLSFTPIIDGSEEVRVDEQPQQRGVDYRLNYQTGELWFDPVDGPSKAIPSTSTISVSYQSSGYFGNAGTLTGARAQMPLSDGRMKLGVTWLEQDRPEVGQGDTVAYQEDIYYGSGTTGPFDTNFRPIIADGVEVVYQGQTQTIAEALKVFMDDMKMVEGIDYDAYRQMGRIIFRIAVPPTALVRIQYYYDLGQTALSNDAQVTGVDISYELSKDMRLRADFARSDSLGSSGSALQTVASYRQPKFNILATYRDIAPQFSYIDATGFRRNDKGLELDIGWRPMQHVKVRGQLADLDSTQGLSFGYSGYGGGAGFDSGTGTFGAGQLGLAQSTPEQNIATQSSDVAVELRFPHWPATVLRRRTMSNAGGSAGDSDYTETSIELRHSFGDHLRLETSLSETDQDYLGDDSSEATGSQTRRQRISARYSPTSAFNLIVDLGNNRSEAVGGEQEQSNSDYTRLSTTWSPSDRLSFRVEHSASTSTGRVSSGFYGGFPGSGYGGGGGFSGPIAGGVRSQLSQPLPTVWPPATASPAQDDDEETPHYEDTTTSFSATYRPTDKLSLTLSGGQRKYLSAGGSGYLTDSNQDYQNLGITWQATEELALNTNFSRDQLDFLEEGRGSVSNDSLVVGLNYRPQNRPWSVNLSMNRMAGTSPSYIHIGGRERYYQTDTSLFDLSGQLRYRVSDNVSLSAELGLSNFNSGYSAFDKQIANISATYDLGGPNRATFGYRFIGHRAGEPSSPFLGYTGTTVQSQDYNAHSFMLTLQSSFTSGVGGSGFQGPRSTMDSGPRRGTFGGYQKGWQSYGGSKWDQQQRRYPGEYDFDEFPQY